MEKPNPGYYRRLLSDPNIRIAFTHTPIIGCTRVPFDKSLEDLRNSTDEFAPYYIEGLTNGNMVTIVENHCYQNYFTPGELYFKS